MKAFIVAGAVAALFVGTIVVDQAGSPAWAQNTGGDKARFESGKKGHLEPDMHRSRLPNRQSDDFVHGRGRGGGHAPIAHFRNVKCYDEKRANGSTPCGAAIRCNMEEEVTRTLCGD
jgi:hypothetical protein